MHIPEFYKGALAGAFLVIWIVVVFFFWALVRVGDSLDGRRGR